MPDKKREWFENWFDSPYYHILYKNRNCIEAESFINNLVNYLHPKKNCTFLDLGCGKGRHAVYLNKKGFQVTGLDLSSENIECASKFENKNLNFFVEDMRKIDRTNQFNFVFNLFTSFGYFENESDNYATINGVSKSLKPNGIFVIDFMNVQKEIANLVSEETKTIDAIDFVISRRIERNFIIKQINFSDQGTEYNFQERVKAITLNDFEKYFDLSRLKILNLLGNYNLDEFNSETSERLIIIAQKG